jgi:tyrosine phenol-lyase|tara:strand:- start:1846 stop:1971 length:126 start_codon:yes stop_codon:yes gene_type:complete
MDVTAESVIRVMQNTGNVKGLRFVYEPEMLNFFQGRFEEIE